MHYLINFPHFVARCMSKRNSCNSGYKERETPRSATLSLPLVKGLKAYHSIQ